MAEKSIINQQGEQVGTIEIPTIFSDLPNTALIYEAIKNERANLRVGTASTKTRSQVHGSNKKPWAQKGLGRARAGDKKSPIWRGGGIVFGPQPKPWSYRLPKKVKRGAFISLLSLRLPQEDFCVFDQWSEFSGRTKEASNYFDSFLKDTKSVLVIGAGQQDKMLRQALRNIPSVIFQDFDKLTSVALFYSKKILITQSTLEALTRHLDSKKIKDVA